MLVQMGCSSCVHWKSALKLSIFVPLTLCRLAHTHTHDKVFQVCVYNHLTILTLPSITVQDGRMLLSAHCGKLELGAPSIVDTNVGFGVTPWNP